MFYFSKCNALGIFIECDSQQLKVEECVDLCFNDDIAKCKYSGMLYRLKSAPQKIGTRKGENINVELLFENTFNASLSTIYELFLFIIFFLIYQTIKVSLQL